jgi:hypothetical protein
MTDHDLLVQELLEEQVPLRPDAEPDWAEVMIRSGSSDQPKPRSWIRRPRVLVPALILFALLATGVAFAVDGIPWWETAPAPSNQEGVDLELAPDVNSDFPPSPDRTRARTVAKTDGAELVAAPVGDDGYCLAIFVDGHSAAGHSCEYQATDEAYTYARPGIVGDPHWLVYGRFADPKAAILDLSEAAGVPLLVQLHYSGFFLANVPKDRWELLSRQSGEARLLDRSGATLRTGCVSWGPGPADDLVKSDFRGIGKLPFWHGAGDDCRALPATIDVAGATKLVELTLGGDPDYSQRGVTIALWLAPQKDGTVCVVDALASPQLDPSPSLAGGQVPVNWNPPTSSKCGSRESLEQTPPGHPIAVSVSGSQSSGDYARWRFEGHVNPDSGIVKLELHPASDRVTLAFANGWFLGQLPKSDSWHEFPRGGPYMLVGYEAGGHEIARVDLRDAWEAQKARH